MFSIIKHQGSKDNYQLKPLLRKAFNVWITPPIDNPSSHWYALISHPEQKAVACGEIKDNVLWNFAVHPSLQKQGLGKILLNHIRVRHPHITWQVLENNTKAQQFYQRCGAHCYKRNDPQLWSFVVTNNYESPFHS